MNSEMAYSDALPVRYGRPVEAQAIELGSFNKAFSISLFYLTETKYR